MSITADAAGRPEVGLPTGSVARRRLVPRTPAVAAATVVIGATLIVIAGALPIWGSLLQAPQYPKGLDLWVFGGRMEGDIAEIGGLNHYIGMRMIDISIVPEVALWPIAVVSGVVLLAAAVFLPGIPGRLAVLGLSAIPVGVLADIQLWLARYGTELDPTAALRVDPFIPLVIGPTKVWNFTIWTYPGPAIGLFALAIILAIIGRRVAQPSPRVRIGLAAAVTIAAVVATLTVVIPAVRPVETGGAGSPSPPAGTADIERLLAEAPAGATVLVPAGSYHVHLVIAKPVTLVADGEVLLDGDGKGTVVLIGAPDVTLRGFRVAGSGGQVQEGAGIKVIADRVTLEGNRVERAFTGIAAFDAHDLALIDNTVVGSGQVSAGAEHATRGTAATSVAPASATPGAPAGPDASVDPHAGHGIGAGPSGQGDGISLWASERVLLRGNEVRDVRDGVYLNYVDDVLLDTNSIVSSRYAVHAMFGNRVTAFGNEVRGNLSGFVFMYTSGVLAGRNKIVDQRSPATGFGVVLKDVVGVELHENVIARNRVGIQAEGTGRAGGSPGTVLRNRIASNDVGVALMATADLAFGGNAFEGNLTQVLALEPGVERSNDWTDGYVGNAWSDYAGYDLAADGFGDVPYRSGATGMSVVIRDPALGALRTSPGLGLLALAQSVWDAGRTTVVVDDAPLTGSTEALPNDVPPADDAIAWTLAGGVLVLLAVVGFVRLAGPGRRPTGSVL